MSRHHTISILQAVDRPYLAWLRSGVKTAEGRVNTPRYRAMRPGDLLTLVDKVHDESLTGTIAFLHSYEAFDEMLRQEGVCSLLPFLGEGDVEAGAAVYESFPGASRVRQFGCVAIGLCAFT